MENLALQNDLKTQKKKSSLKPSKKTQKTHSLAWTLDHQLHISTLPILKLRKSFEYNSKITAVAYSSIQSLVIIGLDSGKIHFINTKTLSNVKTLQYIHKCNKFPLDSYYLLQN